MIFSSAQIKENLLKTIFFLKTRTQNQNFEKKRNFDSTENYYVWKPQNMWYGESASTWSILSVFISDTFVSVYFRPFLNLLTFSHFKSLKFTGCLERFQVRIALNLPKCVLFINILRLSCLSKICSFYIATLDRFLYPGGEVSFSAENSK